MNHPHFHRLIAAAIIMLVVSSAANAQIGLGSTMQSAQDRVTNTNYYFARPNDLTIIVNVVGFVQRPGRYEIANTIDLINVISLAGGPTADGALNKVTITRIVKNGDRSSWKELHVNLDDLKTVTTAELALEPGDVIAVDRTAWSAFRDGFSVLVSGAIIVTAVSEVIIASRR